MPLDFVDRYIEADWSPAHNDLLCPHCGHEVPEASLGMTYFDQPYPDDCVWKCNECGGRFAVSVGHSITYRTAVKFEDD